jgi:DNA repair exonuclease SbcCD nuclease subunit
MRLIHFADVHLGYRAYHRLTPSGVNQREQDVQDAFNRTLKKISELDPDLILMAGDLFHSVRPSNLVLQRAFKSFLRLKEKCSAPVVMIAGNHESPRSAETGCILRLFENIPGVIVRDGRYDALRLPDSDVSVYCLPHRGLGELSTLQIAPSAESGANLLMLHGVLEGVRDHLDGGITLSRSQILSDSWDYIACGHYHIHTQLSENAFYCGSTEFTSHNPWEETGKNLPGKGFIEFDTETRKMAFHSVETRTLQDLPAIRGEGLSAAEIMGKIESAVASVKGSLAEKIVRLVVWDVPRKIQADLNHAALREIRSQALHFDLSLRPPRPKGFNLSANAVPRRTLEQEWSDYVHDARLPAGIDRESFQKLGADYLAQASAETVPTDGRIDGNTA